AYYYYSGDEAHGGGWYPAVGGYLKEDPKAGVGVWFYGGMIHDDYARTKFKNTVIHYYKELLKDYIPWEFNLDMTVNGYHDKKNYEEALKDKDLDSVSSLDVSIYMSSKILEEYNIEEYQEVFLKVAKGVYRLNSYLEDSSYIRFWLIDASKEEINEYSLNYLLKKYGKIKKYSPYVRTRFLNNDFFKIKNYKQMKEYIEKRDKNFNLI
ncbi:MAG: hypothetical protein WBG30_06865, partial [Psychrilyobacter sp.]|uniref:hypothetical protein n=1 Tax=Psychrilyobacter sp. TaxID=2586924 RepID=UPI003C7596AF